MVVRGSPSLLLAKYEAVRRFTEHLVGPLEAEDMQAQSMPDASPVKWHLGHTTWFFEAFVLGGPPFREGFARLFNSYYEAMGERHPRAERGLLTRPTLEEVMAYRRAVDQRMERLLARELAPEVASVVEVGLNHEQQHQELILTDVKHLFAQSPLLPVYSVHPERAPREARGESKDPLAWIPFEETLAWIGAGRDGFAYDNERPRHRVIVPGFELASRLVTVREYRAFIRDGGYSRPELWLSDGWRTCQERGFQAPLYWGADGVFTLSGLRPLIDDEPVCHVSFYEADAYARWAGARLPREEEWEVAATGLTVSGNFIESGELHPRPARGGRLTQLFGDAWEWTASPYVGYAGFRPEAGVLGEYNGKFMCNQLVLRGGSCVTPAKHMRATYRNFFAPDARWQFSGIRLARDL